MFNNKEEKSNQLNKLKGINSKKETKSNFGSINQSKSPTINMLGAIEETANESQLKKRGRKKKREDISKLTFHVVPELHAKMKSYSARSGQPMQHIIEAAITEYLNAEQKPTLINDFAEAEFEGKPIRTTVDLEPATHEQLANYSNEANIKIRFIIEALMCQFLRNTEEM